MATDDSKPVHQFTGIPIKHLIGAPLKAASDANGMLARSQLQLILDSCFEHASDSALLKPIMVEMHLERDVILSDGAKSNEKVSMTISVPLLTLIPINTLSVDDIKVSFDMEIQCANEERFQGKNSKSNTQEKKSDENNKSNLEMYGNLASKGPAGKENNDRKSSMNAHYEVQMHAGNLPLPTGLTTIIDLLNKSIAPLPMKSKTLEGN